MELEVNNTQQAKQIILSIRAPYPFANNHKLPSAEL